MMEKATPEAAKAETWVFWDIKSFPVPPGFDARLVRPAIKRFLEKYGYFGPLTIHAGGILTDFHDDFLQALSSTGITLHYTPFSLVLALHRSMDKNQPPANIIVLSKHMSPPIKSKYNCLRPFSYSSYEENIILWESLFLADLGGFEDTCCQTGESASWSCIICNVHDGQGFERFTSHLSSLEHTLQRFGLLPVKDYMPADKFRGEDMVPFKMVVRNQPERLELSPVKDYIPMEKFAAENMNPFTMVVRNQPDEADVAVTSVFWDIKRFPVPPGFDASLVRPCIKRFLKKNGYTGPRTICAVGMLTDIHDDILRALSSTGISLYYTPYSTLDITKLMLKWIRENQSPANILGLSNPKFFPPSKSGYNVFGPFLYSSHEEDTIFWKNIILADSGAVDEETCSDTVESASWNCRICYVHGHGFGSFTRHLSSQKHTLEWMYIGSLKQRLRRLPVKNGFRAEKFEEEDIFPFTMVVRNQPEDVQLGFKQRVHTRTKQPKASLNI